MYMAIWASWAIVYDRSCYPTPRAVIDGSTTIKIGAQHICSIKGGMPQEPNHTYIYLYNI